MNTFIRIAGDWADEDVLQLQFEVCDGTSTFVGNAYASFDWFAETAANLERFRTAIYGGLYDLEVGTPGPEFAGGALVARLHWYRPTELLISTRQESDFFPFKGSQVARTGTSFLRTEPALLDRFVEELQATGARQRNGAVLECVPLHGA